MSFCKYCGKQLADGELCDCAQSVEERNSMSSQAAPEVAAPQQNSQQDQFQQGQPMPQGGQFQQGQPMPQGGQFQQGQQYQGQYQQPNQYQQYAQAQANQVVSHMSNAFKSFLEIMKKPITGGTQFIANAVTAQSIVLIIVQALISSLLGTVLISNINKLMTLANDEDYLFSGVKGFFVTLIFSVLFSVLFAGLFWLGYKIVKADISFEKALAIAGLRSAELMPIMLIGLIISLFNVAGGIVIYELAGIMAFAAVTAVLMCEQFVEADKKAYVIIAVLLVFVIVSMLIMSKAVMLYVPSSIKDGINGASGLMNILGIG